MKLRNAAGMSLTELLIGTMLVGMVVLVTARMFITLSRGILVIKMPSVAASYGQDQMESLKIRNYYRLQVTTVAYVPSELANATPPIYHDIVHFPVDSTVQGNITYYRCTRVDYVNKIPGQQDVAVVGWTMPDTGLKQITVTTAWQREGQWREVQLTSLIEDPRRQMANLVFQGQVTTTGAVPLAGVIVEPAGFDKYSDATDNTGQYSFSIRSGTYSIRASSAGYFPVTVEDFISAANSPRTLNFTLNRRETGTITGRTWVNSHPVISRVAGSTAAPGGFSQEYIEIFNPTTWTWTADGGFVLALQRRPAQDPDPLAIDVDFSPGGSDVLPGGFYLLANTPTVIVDGVAVDADAIWDRGAGRNALFTAQHFNPPLDPNIIPAWGDSDNPPGIVEGAAGLLLNSPGGVRYDAVGWQGGGCHHPGVYEGTPVNAGCNGLEPGQEFVRFSSPTLVSAAWGPSYDSADNNANGRMQIISSPPRNTSSAALALAAGTPASGALVYAADGISPSAQADGNGNFTIPSVATGTWPVIASSGSAFFQTSASLSSGGDVASLDMVLGSTASGGFISGRVTDDGGAPLSGIILSPGNVSTDANGRYLFYAPQAGQIMVNANPYPGNEQYDSQSAPLTIQAGQLYSGMDFALGRSTRLYGTMVTNTGIPLPGITVVATRHPYGEAMATEVSGNDGRFYLNVGSGTWLVTPQMVVGEVSSPANKIVSASGSGAAVFIATFSVTASLATIEGNLAVNGQSIPTGVMVLARPTSYGVFAPGNPPDLSGCTACSVVTGDADGHFRLSVSQITTYNVYAWYTILNGDTTTSVRSDLLNLPTTNGGISTANFSW